MPSSPEITKYINKNKAPRPTALKENATLLCMSSQNIFSCLLFRICLPPPRLPASSSFKHKGQLNWHQVKLVFHCHFSGHHPWQLRSRWFGPSHVTVLLSALHFTLQKSFLSAPIQFDRSGLHLQAGAMPPWQDLSQHSSHRAQPNSNFTQRQVCYDDF